MLSVNILNFVILLNTALSNKKPPIVDISNFVGVLFYFNLELGESVISIDKPGLCKNLEPTLPSIVWIMSTANAEIPIICIHFIYLT